MTRGADESVTWIDDAGADTSVATRSRMLQGYAAYVEAIRAGGICVEIEKR